ncbi:MAG TPA: acyl-CoA dehydrogenase, partial [Acidimicrobiales bacterium]
MIAPDLDAAAVVVEQATVAVETAARHLASAGGPDEHQVVAYDLAHAAASVECARAVLDYGSKGEVEARLACAFVADAVHDLWARTVGREDEWGTEPGHLEASLPFVRAYRSPGFLADLAGEEGPRHLDSDFEMVQDTFRRFAEDRIRPVAEAIHRHNEDIP